MKPILFASVLTALLVVAPTPCFALWTIASVTKESAKELGLEIRTTAAGPENVRVELEFKAEDKLKGVSRVDLRIGDGDKEVTATLKEDRTKDGRVVVSFSAHQSQIEKIKLWMMLPEALGGSIYEIRAKDFVELPKAKEVNCR